MMPQLGTDPPTRHSARAEESAEPGPSNAGQGAERVARGFSRAFQGRPTRIVLAPGRVNLIGEHTDYNEGFVLPMAIDRAVWIALRPRMDDRVRLDSLDYRQSIEFDLDSLQHGGPAWGEYAKAVAWAMQAAGHRLRGWEGVMSGEVPVGAGLSSSAAVELATARAFAIVSSIRWDAHAMAWLAQRAENEWVGVACGIMDQLTSACGLAQHALQIDCRSLTIEPVPLPVTVSVLVLDTGTRRGLVNSAYNRRREECQEGAQAFGLGSLRDLTQDAFAVGEAQLEPAVRRRLRHVLSENARTLRAGQALRDADMELVGRLMAESHASLRDDFEVSSPALDAMVEIASAQPGCWGARMTGAGFGGCAVALVEREVAPAAGQAIASAYQDRMKLQPAVYVCRAADGAGELPARERFLS
jgi:galactokinase